MNDFTQFKPCRKGVDCKHPDRPNLPLSEFYPHKGTKDGLYSICKKCHYAQTKANGVKRGYNREVPAIDAEGMVITVLRANGIYATTGKASEFRSCDVSIWGGLRCECKSSTKDKNGRYLFKFDSQKRNGINADLIILQCVQGNGQSTYHVFPADHSVFYINGRIKTGVRYDPAQTNPMSGRGERLTRPVMQRHENAWHLIEEKRLALSRQLAGECFKPERVQEPELLMLPLFKDAS